MVSRITLFVLGFCFFFGKVHTEEDIIDEIAKPVQDAAHHVQLISNVPNSDGEINPKYICSGSLVTNEIVLTAANCVTDIMKYGNVEVYAGSVKMYDYVQKRSGNKTLIHPYVTAKDKADKNIALIKVNEPFSSPKITPIEPTMALIGFLEPATVNGFSVDDKLDQSSTPILKKFTGASVDCSYYQSEVFSRTDFCIPNSAGQLICKEDSGSGLVNSQGELIGVTDASGSDPCNSNNINSFTSVYDHLNFIIAGLQRLSPDDELAKQIAGKMKSVFTKFSGSLMYI